MAYEKGFEKRALEQQAAILGCLQKIQVALEHTPSSSGPGDSVLLAPMNILMQSNVDILGEMKSQTSVLKDIRSSIKDAISQKSRSGDDAGKNETRSAKDKIMDVAAKVGDTVKNIALLAGAIVVFAGALKLVAAIIKPADLMVVVPFMLVMSLAFAVFSKIVEASKGLTIKESLATGILMVSIASAIVGIAGVFSVFKGMGQLSFPDPLWVLGAGLAIFIFTLPVMLLVKAMSSGGKIGGESVAPTPLSPKTALTVGLLMVTTAVAIAGVAAVFSKMLVPVTPADAPNLVWALTAGLGIAIFGLTTAMFIKNIKQTGGFGDMVRIPVIIAGAIIATAAGMVGAAYVMKGFPQVGPEDAPDIIWALTTGLSLAIFSIGLVLVAKYVKDAKSALVGGLAMVIVAGIIFTTAWIFNYLPDTLRAPTLDFVRDAGIAIAAFGAAYALMTKFIGDMSIGSLLKGALAMVVTAALIVGVAWIFQLLPEDLRYPSEEFSLGAGVAIAVFGAAIAGLGMLVEAITPVGFLFGALAALVAALVIVGVAWIFTLLPEDLFKQGGIIYTATDALVYFGTGMITLFEKFGEALVDIGLKFLNGIGDFIIKIKDAPLLSIAGGISAIAGSMVLLAGALVGSNVAASAGNLVSSVLDFGASLFGKDTKETEKPQGLLEYIVNNASTIIAAGTGIDMIGTGIKNVAASAAVGAGVLSNFVDAILGPAKGRGIFPGVTPMAFTVMDEITLGFNSMTIQLDKLTTYRKPLEQVADSMNSFAKSTREFADAINSIELEKMNALGATMESLKKNLDESMVNNMKIMADQTDKMASSSGGVVASVTGIANKVIDTVAGGDKDTALAKKIAQELMTLLATTPIKATGPQSATFEFKNGTQFIANVR